MSIEDDNMVYKTQERRNRNWSLLDEVFRGTVTKEHLTKRLRDGTIPVVEDKHPWEPLIEE